MVGRICPPGGDRVKVSENLGATCRPCGYIPDISKEYMVWPKRAWPSHTAGSDTILIQIYMDAPPGVPGMSKKFFYK